YHWYVTVPPKGKRPEIIVDSTYLQFFRDAQELEAPEIFVGTREQLIAFFEKHRDRLDYKEGNGGTGALPPAPVRMSDVVDALYGLGARIGNRTEDDVVTPP